MTSPEKMLSTRELAALFAVDKRTILRWAKAGYLPTPVRAGDKGNLRWYRSQFNGTKWKINQW